MSFWRKTPVGDTAFFGGYASEGGAWCKSISVFGRERMWPLGSPPPNEVVQKVHRGFPVVVKTISMEEPGELFYPMNVGFWSAVRRNHGNGLELKEKDVEPQCDGCSP
ncbi:hypothetical protein NL676_038994 [Syzygium grande]|nr:hypothetical protein NL676_038994 [Syzygium grande]